MKFLKKYTLTVCILMLSVFSSSQNIQLQWAKSIGEITYTETGRSIIVDKSGNVYTIGGFGYTMDADPGPSSFSLTSAGYSDVFISKLDAAGNFIWAKSFGGANSDNAGSITMDATGNIYIAGSFQGLVDFDPGPGTFTLNTTSSTSSNAYILKLNPAGDLIWVKSFGGNGLSSAGSIVLDSANNIYTTGSYAGPTDFDPGASSSYTLGFVGNTDIFISKLDSAGNFLWAKGMGSHDQEFGVSITVDVAGNVYTTGLFQLTIDFDPGNGVVNLTSLGDTDIFILKLDATGNLVWAKRQGGAGRDWPHAIKIDAAGYLYTTGTFQGSTDFGLTTSGTADAYVLKLNTSGNLIWAKRMGGSTVTSPSSLALDGSSNIYITGSFSGTSDFDPIPTTSYTLTSKGMYDVFVVKLNTTGNLVWAKSVGDTLNDAGYCGALDSFGNIHITGYFDGTVDFDPNPTSYNLVSAGYGDVFISKWLRCDAITTSLTAQSNILCHGTATGSATIAATSGPGLTYTWSPLGGNAAAASGLPAGTYTVDVVNSCNMATTHTVLITEPPALTITLTASPSVMCAGNSATLTASAGGGTGPVTYTWAANGSSNTVLIVNPPDTTIYTVLVSDGYSCTESQTISIAVNSLPVVDIKGNQPICVGESETLTASGADTYSWDAGTSGVTMVVSPTITTTYSVTGTSSLTGCENTTFQTVTVDLCTGITNSYQENHSLFVYPNPSNEQFILSFKNGVEKIIEVIDYTGKIIYSTTTSKDITIINLSEFSNGIYHIKVTSKDAIQLLRIIKQ